jgi:aldehyde:ferredoxin oxidoreductase
MPQQRPNPLHPTLDTAPPGYHGRALLIDLTTGTSREWPLPEAWLRRVIGGVGLGAWLLSEHTPD